MSACPPQYVEAPAVQARPGGLFSAAIFPPNDGHVLCGVEYEPDSCGGKAFTTHDPCREEGPRSGEVSTTAASAGITSTDLDFKAADVGRTITGTGIPDGTTIAAVTDANTATMSAPATATGSTTGTVGPAAGFPGDLSAGDGGVDLVAGTPFTVYAGFKCTLVGRSLVDAQARAEAALAFGEQRAVEYAYWTGSEGNTPRLADASAAELGTALSPTTGIARLEGYLAKNYGGLGVIHAPVELAVPWPEGVEGSPSDGFRTALGTRLVYGAGYSVANTGPDGTPAPDGTAWAYATGAVAIWRGPVDFNPTPVQQALDKKSNTVELLAHRTYVIGHECVLAAVNITLP